MNKRLALKRTVSFVTALLILCSLTISLFSCGDPVTKDDLVGNIASTVENDRYNYDYVTLYLYDWQFPSFDTKKLSWVEQKFIQYYNVTEGMPETLDHAVMTAEKFLEKYYDTIDLLDVTAVTDALITSYIEVIGDPYSLYRTPDESADFSQSMSGHFGGIGVAVEYDHVNNTVLVISVTDGGPAHGAGILPGDYIVGADGNRIEDVGYDNMLDYVRGIIGTEVTITVKRGEAEHSYTMVRTAIENQSVQYAVTEDNIGYIRITQFDDSTINQFKEAVDAIEEAGAKGVVFDLRNNHGGAVNSVVAVMSYILPTGKTILSYQYKNQPEKVLTAHNDGINEETGEVIDHILDIPMTVVCNQYTASAAEIFTSVIRDYRNEGLIDAVIVGKNTYKKGVIQTTFVYYEDETLISITTAYYQPPSGENYHGIGIAPDVDVSLPELKEGETYVEDTQLAAALEELDKLINDN